MADAGEEVVYKIIFIYPFLADCQMKNVNVVTALVRSCKTLAKIRGSRQVKGATQGVFSHK